jgi:hypothetical protein
MELDITDFVTNAEPYEFSASVAERGPNAGPQTWANAVTEGASKPLLTTPDQIEEFRDYMGDFGAWDDAERAAWSDAECNALLIQLISGDMRESGMDSCDIEDFDWDQYQKDSEDGRISGRIYRADTDEHTGRIFYYIGS